MIKIYLDWNVFTSMMNFEKISNLSSRETFWKLKQYLELREDNILIPYSNAHLNDLMKSYYKGDHEKTKESIEYISLLTKDLCLTQYWNEENAKFHYRNALEFFESNIEDEKSGLKFKTFEDVLKPLKEFGLDKIFDIYKTIPHNMDIEQMEKHSPLLASLFPRSKKENNMYASILDTFEMFQKFKNNPVTYNQLRNLFKDGIGIGSNINTFQNVIEQLDEYLPKTMLNKSFNELYEENNQKNYLRNKDFERLTGVYMQLDFVGYKTDTLTDKNQYDNLFNDAQHCFYAAHCEIYITNDNKNYKKTKAVFQSEQILTQVMKPLEFVNYVEEIIK